MLSASCPGDLRILLMVGFEASGLCYSVKEDGAQRFPLLIHPRPRAAQLVCLTSYQLGGDGGFFECRCWKATVERLVPVKLRSRVETNTKNGRCLASVRDAAEVSSAD